MTTTGTLTEFTLSRAGAYNVGIASGPDENLWFTESESGYIGKITTKDEVSAEYALPGASKPYGITAGPDKNLWFTDYGTGKISKITTSGTVTEYDHRRATPHTDRGVTLTSGRSSSPLWRPGLPSGTRVRPPAASTRSRYRGSHGVTCTQASG